MGYDDYDDIWSGDFGNTDYGATGDNPWWDMAPNNPDIGLFDTSPWWDQTQPLSDWERYGYEGNTWVNPNVNTPNSPNTGGSIFGDLGKALNLDNILKALGVASTAYGKSQSDAAARSSTTTSSRPMGPYTASGLQTLAGLSAALQGQDPLGSARGTWEAIMGNMPNYLSQPWDAWSRAEALLGQSDEAQMRALQDEIRNRYSSVFTKGSPDAQGMLNKSIVEDVLGKQSALKIAQANLASEQAKYGLQEPGRLAALTGIAGYDTAQARDLRTEITNLIANMMAAEMGYQPQITQREGASPNTLSQILSVLGPALGAIKV